MQPTPTPQPFERRWYDNAVLANVLLFLFFPVGLYALWKSRSIATWWKVGGTVLIAFIILGQLGKGKNSGATATPETLAEVSSAKELSPAEQKAKEAQEKADAEAESKRAAAEIAANTIDAPSLVGAYMQNEVKADQNFKGKTFYVSGTVDQISKDIMDNIYVTLEGDGVIRSVQCYLDDADVAANLNKGEQVVIKGKCDGLMMNVQMKDCSLVK